MFLNMTLFVKATTTTDTYPPRNGAPPPFTYQTYLDVMLLLKVCLTGPVAIVGVVSNVINIMVFKRQGILESSPTLALTSLAISDLMSSFFSILGAIIGGSHYAVDIDKTWGILEGHVVPFLTTRPQNVFCQISSCVTVYATIERMMSVMLPLKVKLIFTPKNSLCVIVLIYLVNLIMNIPILFQALPAITHYSKLNATYFEYRILGLPQALIDTGVMYNSVIIFSALIIVTLSNSVIVWKVKLSQKFRSLSSSANPSSQTDKEDNTTGPKNNKVTKEMRLLKMITVISSVFVMCYISFIPFSVVFRFTYTINKDYHYYTAYTAYNVMILLQMFNAGINFIIYYKLSTRYREEIHAMFGRGITKGA